MMALLGVNYQEVKIINMINYILFALFVALQFGDAWTTIQCINQDKGHEANGLMTWLFSKIGMVQALMITKVGICGVAWILKDIALAIGVIDVLYAYVVYQNYRILKL